ncbi:hypothetical protein DM01DRAFT_1334987 [Hesseltinella vesiculosa]|uniref:Uncharacterized protein n=1 Tax=Hesseltinella vesiculosa TaxID=101127 RepID=A0A1X2GJX5_9FUNG|nr:hypothetical protein DM01DRAFT_1334987 [Hesseltinella vesiculosa]
MDFLDSPLLFPSDMEHPKLSSDPTFKLPEAIQWADYDYDHQQLHHPLADKPSLTSIFQLDPIPDPVAVSTAYASFLQLDISKGSLQQQDQLPRNLPMLALMASLAQAYQPPMPSPKLHDQERTNELRAALRCALDIVENDMQLHDVPMHAKHPHPHEPASAEALAPSYHDHYQQDLLGELSWHTDLMDVPDLISCSTLSSASSSFTSLLDDDLDTNSVDDQPEPLALLLESDVSHASLDFYSPPSMITHLDHFDSTPKSTRPSLKQWMAQHIKPVSMKKKFKALAKKFLL